MSFTNSSNFQVDSSIVNSITGTNNTTTNYYQNFSRNEFGLSTLAKEVAFSALHDSEARYPQPNVLPGTREEILRRLSGWCEHPSKSSRVFWVSGAAGVGKSAIAQALSEKYIQTGQLAAGFFFSRNDSSRDKLEPFVATIAHQLATSNHALKPLVSPHISQIVSSMPGILHKNVESQFQTLIAEPCAQVDPRRWTQLPRLIIIDGVDECISVASQKRLLEMIKTMTTTLPFDFLLFSRPEPHISQIFRHESFIPTPFSLSLGDFAQAVQEDIKKYLYHEFARIREEHWHNLPRPQASWPGNSIILQLLHKSTGQFIYATTVTKYIKHGKLPLTPMKRLDVILQAKGMVNSSSPYPDLDLLYSQILQFCINEDVKLQQILRLIVSPFGHYKAPEPNKAWNQEPRRSLYRLHLQLYGAPESVGYTSLWALEHLLELGQGEASVLLSGLHSILDVPASPVENVNSILAQSFLPKTGTS
ncbi:hypothetical protein L218DRAFT_505677 [Marasmius fiardii PR-910]|nr:hypothetical protein L218DRAFT_505677 [Marasmius fiardii PR-910]